MLRPTVNHPYIIGICGASASGKTHFINRLKEGFAADQLSIISQDNYYKGVHEQIVDENGQVNYDYPGGIDFDQLVKDLDALRSGKSITCKEYQFQLAHPREVMIEIKPAPVIIVEGLFVYYVEKLFEQLNLRLVIDAEEDIKLQRRITRDTAERGVPHEYVLYQWHNHVFPAYEKYLLPFIGKADMVILNNHGFDVSLEIIRNYLRQLL